MFYHAIKTINMSVNYLYIYFSASVAESRTIRVEYVADKLDLRLKCFLDMFYWWHQENMTYLYHIAKYDFSICLSSSRVTLITAFKVEV